MKASSDPVPDELTSESVVIEGGCYEGAWVAKVHKQLRCTIHAFEPATRAYAVASKRLAELPRVSVWPVALGSECGMMTLHDCKRDGATAHPSGGEPSEVVPIVDAAMVVALLGTVDLIHLNAEGGELDILERLIETGQIANVRMLLAQWHPRAGDKGNRIARLEAALVLTHDKQNRHTWGCWQLKQKGTT